MRFLGPFAYIAGIALGCTFGARGQTVDFNRDVRPILSENCFHCHGPDAREARKAGLRLDQAETAYATLESGRRAVVPARPESSEMIRRITTADSEERMPPPESKRRLTSNQIDLLRKWVASGAGYETQWSLRPPRKAPVAGHPIDDLIRRRLRQAAPALEPAERAAPQTLVRRLFLDLVGLPPSPEEAAAFARKPSPRAYEKLVDRLLASPRFGEKWARAWLDAARYADSNGFQADQLRESWAYRDWVIDALNAGMPFDQFTIEQLAGDLLPASTFSQKVATGFHRTVTCNVEAGVHPEENRVNQVVDRVNTTATVWLGTTLECAQCHDHKYDPFTMRDYYGLFAFFNNTPIEVRNPSGKGVSYDFYGPKIELPLSSRDETEREQLRKQLKAAERRFQAMREISKSEASGGDESATRDIDNAPFLETAESEMQDLRKRLEELEPSTTLVMVEMEEPRPTHVLERGRYLDKGEAVNPATPSALPPMDETLPKNRLGLARWLVDFENPLVARVTVNRWWAEIFGRGLVATLEDFGTQAEPPTHPELLDWLAVEFMESGWSMKRMVKLIVLSETYQQASTVSAQHLAIDPENKFYSRGPRFRLPAELIRDHALSVAGLLSAEMGGPPVMPHQPENIWRQVGRNEPVWEEAMDDRRYRRGIYVVWRRAAPYPSFVNFDGGDRSACVLSRSRTNTPLQALTLLNDPAYLESATALAVRIVREIETAADDAAMIDHAFRLVLARPPQEAERRHLLKILADSSTIEPDFLAHSADGYALPEDIDRSRVARWFPIAHILLNLDETITKQ